MGTVADYVVRRLREWGMYRVYGYPGAGINGLTGALRRAESDAARGPTLPPNALPSPTGPTTG
jgi:pyruvate dehydrogenase (quinone)